MISLPAVRITPNQITKDRKMRPETSQPQNQRPRPFADPRIRILIILKLLVLFLELITVVEASLPKKRKYRRAFREDPVQVKSRLLNLNTVEFRQRYRIDKRRFNLLLEDLDYKKQYCAFYKPGHEPEVRLAASLRILTQGVSPRAICADYCMGYTTLRLYFEAFLDDMLALYEQKYLEPDLREVVRVNESVHKIPGLVGSLDCTHFAWAMCPKAHQASFQGRSGSPSIKLECIADAHRRVVHFYYGSPGAQNDINTLKESTIMDKFVDGRFPFNENYCIGGETFKQGWVLVDGIYQNYSTFLKAIARFLQSSLM